MADDTPTPPRRSRLDSEYSGSLRLPLTNFWNHQVCFTDYTSTQLFTLPATWNNHDFLIEGLGGGQAGLAALAFNPLSAGGPPSGSFENTRLDYVGGAGGAGGWYCSIGPNALFWYPNGPPWVPGVTVLAIDVAPPHTSVTPTPNSIASGILCWEAGNRSRVRVGGELILDCPGGQGRASRAMDQLSSLGTLRSSMGHGFSGVNTDFFTAPSGFANNYGGGGYGGHGATTRGMSDFFQDDANGRGGRPGQPASDNPNPNKGGGGGAGYTGNPFENPFGTRDAQGILGGFTASLGGRGPDGVAGAGANGGNGKLWWPCGGPGAGGAGAGGGWGYVGANTINKTTALGYGTSFGDFTGRKGGDGGLFGGGGGGGSNAASLNQADMGLGGTGAQGVVVVSWNEPHAAPVSTVGRSIHVALLGPVRS